MTYFLEYLFFISLVSGGFFYYDKHMAKIKGRRIAELFLHVLEILGGIFINLILMYILPHKINKKYYKFTSYLILLLWLFILFEYVLG